MKITRSTKCSLKFTTKSKQEELNKVLSEYGNVVNVFIDYFWAKGVVSKSELLKSIVDVPDTWLSARLRKVAAREAIDMVKSVQEVFDWNQEQLEQSIFSIETKIEEIKNRPNIRKNRQKVNYLYCKLKKKKNRLSMLQPHKPRHKGNRMNVSCTIAELQKNKKNTRFNAWLHLASIGNKIRMDLPIQFHKHFKRLNQKGHRLNSYIITKDYVQFSFEIETGGKKDVKHLIGIDTGINALASICDNKQKTQQQGTDVKEYIERIKRCQYGSKGQTRARNALRQRIAETAREVVQEADLIVVEKLKDLGKNSKLKGRLSKNVRSSIGSWNYRYWLERLKQCCEENRVSFRSVSPYYTSQMCPDCGHTDRGNRLGEKFRCQSCGYAGNADLVAARNILERFLTGKYGSCYKPLFDKNQFVQV